MVLALKSNKLSLACVQQREGGFRGDSLLSHKIGVQVHLQSNIILAKTALLQMGHHRSGQTRRGKRTLHQKEQREFLWKTRHPRVQLLPRKEVGNQVPHQILPHHLIM